MHETGNQPGIAITPAMPGVDFFWKTPNER